MLTTLWLAAQFVALTLAIAFGPLLPQDPAGALLLLLLGALIITPVAAAPLRRALRALALIPHRPPAVCAAPDHRGLALPCSPGASGTSLARAPSTAPRV